VEAGAGSAVPGAGASPGGSSLGGEPAHAATVASPAMSTNLIFMS
jgi:hypothetical protein